MARQEECFQAYHKLYWSPHTSYDAYDAYEDYLAHLKQLLAQATAAYLRVKEQVAEG